jgi:flagellar biosynthesis/type III secretory pathway chaperone
MLSNKNKNNNLNQSDIVKMIARSLKNLISIIEKENMHLKVGQISSIDMVIEQKVAAISNFNDAQYELEVFVKAGGKFDQKSAELVKLKDLFNRLEVVKKDNEIFIRSNLEVSDQLIEMYKENKTQETMRQYGYNKDGNVSADKMKNAMPSVGLNNKV